MCFFVTNVALAVNLIADFDNSFKINQKFETNIKLDDISVESIRNLYGDITDFEDITQDDVDSIKRNYSGLFDIQILSNRTVVVEFNYEEYKKILHFNTDKIRVAFQKNGALPLIAKINLTLHIVKDDIKIEHTILCDKFYGDTIVIAPSKSEHNFIHIENIYGSDISRPTIKIITTPSNSDIMASSGGSDTIIDGKTYTNVPTKKQFVQCTNKTLGKGKGRAGSVIQVITTEWGSPTGIKYTPTKGANTLHIKCDNGMSGYIPVKSQNQYYLPENVGIISAFNKTPLYWNGTIAFVPNTSKQKGVLICSKNDLSNLE